MIQLSDHFTIRRLLRFTAPSIIMMVFTSIYGVVDGFFVSNFAGKTPFAAVNFIMPVLMILGCPGFMFGTGGSALIAKKLGEKLPEKANGIFTMLTVCAAVLGLGLGALGVALLPAIARLLGAEGEMLRNCVLYGRIVLLATPFYLLQYYFQCLFATAQKPKLGLYVTVAAGVCNMALDALFVGAFRWGLTGAATATAFSQFVGGVIPLIYFAKQRSGSLLVFTRFRFDGRALARTCTNGSSELMSNISMSLVSMLYNGRRRRVGLWCSHVREHDLHRDFHRLLRGLESDRKLSLRRGKQKGAPRPSQKGLDRPVRDGSSDVCGGRARGKAIGEALCGL